MSLSVRLEEDLEWREGELGLLKSQLIGWPISSLRHRTLCRAYLALLYAHYEGFSKFAFQSYIDEIQGKTLSVRQFSRALQTKILEKDISRIRSAEGAEFLRTLGEFEKALSRYSPRNCDAPDTSNLWPNVFLDFCSTYDLRISSIVQHRTRIKTLVARRNDVAHGQKVDIELGELEKLEEAVWDVCIELAVVIVDYIERKFYLIGP